MKLQCNETEYVWNIIQILLQTDEVVDNSIHLYNEII